MTAKLLMSELIKDGAVDSEIVERMCTVFDGGAYLVYTWVRADSVSMPSSKGVSKKTKQRRSRAVQCSRV